MAIQSIQTNARSKSRMLQGGIAALAVLLLMAFALMAAPSVRAFADDGLAAGSMGVQADGATTTLGVQVTYRQTEARSMLQLVNDFRSGKITDGGQSVPWAYAKDGSVDTASYANLGAYTYDYELEKVAMQRAAEIALQYGHQRPNGNNCFSAFPSGYSALGENIACGLGSNDTAQSVFESWSETNDPYSGQGHRRNMLGAGFNRFGVGHAVVHWEGSLSPGGQKYSFDVHYWVQEFGYRSDNFGLSATEAQDEPATQPVDILSSSIKSVTMSPKSSSFTVGCGETKAFDGAECRVRADDGNGNTTWPDGNFEAYNVPIEASYALQSENASIASVSGTQVTGVSVGSTNLVVSTSLASGAQATVPVNVTEKSLSSAKVTLSQDTYTYDGSAKEPGVTVELDGAALQAGTDYTVSYANNIHAGAATATVKGTGNFAGTATASFVIEPAKVDVPSAIEGLMYNGQSQVGVASGAGYTVSGGSQTNAGTHSATASLTNSRDYAWSDDSTESKSVEWSIARAAATVTSNDAAKTYGDDDPEFTATATGLFGNDALQYSFQRDEGESVGSYAIAPAGDAVQGNYDVTYVSSGKLAIGKAQLVIAADDASKTYGAEDPQLTAQVTGFKFNDADQADSVLKYSVSRAAGEGLGTYKITPTVDSVSGNYTASVVEGTFTIGRASAVVKSQNASKAFGHDDPAFTAEVTGLAEGDTLQYSLSREEGEAVGRYAITPTGDAVQGNYNVTFEGAGVLTITKAPGSDNPVTAANLDCVYDGAQHAISASAAIEGSTLQYSVDGGNTWINEAPSWQDATEFAEGAKTVQVRATHDNYENSDVVTVSAMIRRLNINGAIVTVGATGLEYDGAEKTPAVSVTLGDTKLNESAGYEVAYSDNKDAGTATATVTGTGNYEGSASTTFAIAPAQVAVPSAREGLVYNGGPQQGVVEGDGFTASCEPRTAVGGYEATVSLVDAKNYVWSDGSTTDKSIPWSIGLAPVRVSVNDATKVYGEDDPEFTAQVTGLIGNDTVNYDFERESGEDVGSYALAANGAAVQGNYSVVYGPSAKLTIQPAASKIALAAQTKTYNGKALAYSGKVAKSGSTGKVTYRYYTDAACKKEVSAANVKDAKTYYVKATVAASGNYAAATSAPVKFTIAKAANPMTVKASAKTVKVAKLKKAKQVVSPIAVSKAQGKLTFAKKSGASCLTVDKNTGKVTVKKGTKKKAAGYTAKVQVAAAGNANYKSATKTITVKVVVK